MAVLRRRRMTDHQEVDTEGSWAISYGDMITLLLTFFILFFSTDKERDRMNQMEASLLTVLKDNSKLEPKPIEHVGEDPRMEKLVSEKLSAKVYKVGQKLLVEFPETSFFDLGSIQLTEKGQSQLQKFVRLYLPYSGNYILSIRAYTDHKKVIQKQGRSYKDNLELSALRSVAALRVLQKQGLPLNRMRLAGYGEMKLEPDENNRNLASAPNQMNLGMPLARKVVLVVEPEPKENL